MKNSFHLSNFSLRSFDINKCDTTVWKAIAILLIFFHHYSQTLVDINIFIVFRPLGFIGVTIFLFLSGYGLTEQYQRNSNYMSDFCCKTICKILIPFWSLNIIYCLLNKTYNFNLLHIIGILPIDPTMWYMRFLILQYAIFYFIFKYNVKNKLFFLFGFSVLYFFVCNIAGAQKNNYDISFAFFIGCLFSFYKNEIINLLFYKYRIIIPLVILSFLVTFSLGTIGGGYPPLLIMCMRTVSSCLFIIIIILYINAFVSFNNKALIYIGKISFFIYLTHYKVLTYLINNFHLNLLVYIIITFFVSYLFYKIYLKYNKLVNIGGYKNRN